MKNDKMVDHPDHYQGIKMIGHDANGNKIVVSFEAIDIIDSILKHINLPPAESGSMKDVFKYILRANKKNIVDNQGIQDLKKAKWYLNHVIELLENE